MKKLTFIGSVVLSVICLIFTYSYAETYHKASNQYEMCFQDNSLSTYEKNNCYDAEYGRAASWTQFSNLEVRYGFARSILIFCPGAKGYELDLNFRIRCVRDVPANYTFPTN